ncbi:MAG: hypothetical protein V1689_10560 [Pseudomonadota bacterium]
MNVDGGAIAIDHSPGAGGAKILKALIHKLRRRDETADRAPPAEDWARERLPSSRSIKRTSVRIAFFLGPDNTVFELVQPLG